jgi:hypothetical protein
LHISRTTLDLNGLKVYHDTVTPTDPFAPESGVTVMDSLGGGGLIELCTVSLYGDVNSDGLRDLQDIVCVVDGFSGAFPNCTAGDLDISPCGGDGGIDLDDILAALDTFAGQPACMDNCE